MAFYPIEELKKGNVDFMYDFLLNDMKTLAKSIRTRDDYVVIVNGFLDKLKDKIPSFCFDVIYDMKEFSDTAYDLLINKIGIKNLTEEELNNILIKSPYAKGMLENYFDSFLKNESKLDIIINHCLENYSKYKNFVFKLSRYPDLHVRYLFMKSLIRRNSPLINILFDDICKYFTSVTYEENEQITFFIDLMDIDDICDLAKEYLKNGEVFTYKRIKNYIIKNYKYNNLGYLLSYNLGRLKNSIRSEDIGKLYEKELVSDIDNLFLTASKGKIYLFKNYRKLIASELIKKFSEKIKYFGDNDVKIGNYRALNDIYDNGLGSNLEEWIDKYLELSERKDYEFIGQGSTCLCYRIGDYVFKLIKMKWSYEEVICPNLFLIIKNLEEAYVRDKKGIVIAGLEVQKYLSRSSKGIDREYFRLFKEELDNLGYFLTDSLIDGQCGDNTRILDSYKDADIINPESVPAWFKECPLVLIDRDRVYSKRYRVYKQLRSYY